MSKDITDLQVLDQEVSIVLEIDKTIPSNAHLLTRLKECFGKEYTEEDIKNLRFYQDSLCTRRLDDQANFTLEWYETIN